LPRIVLVGGSPWIAFLARVIEGSFKNVREVGLLLYSPGRGSSILHTLFSDKTNLTSSVRTLKVFKRYTGRGLELTRRKGVYIIEDDMIARSIRRVEQTLWRPSRLDQKVVDQAPRTSAPLTIPEAKAYIEFTISSVPSASLSRGLLRSLRHGRGLVTRRVDLVVDEGRVKGVRTPAGFFESDYAIIDEVFLAEKLGLQALPKWLPLASFSCFKLAGPPAQPVIVSDKVILDLTENSMLACVSLPARRISLEIAVSEASRMLSRYLEASHYLVRRIYTGTIVVPPDRSPLIFTHDEWPEGLYAIIGCRGNCLALATGVAESLASLIEGEEGPYGESRLRRGEAFREYLGLPYMLA